MYPKNRIASFYCFMTIVGFLSTSCYSQKKPIIIADQGSFAVGGIVITNPRTFDPIKRTPEGQTFHGDHAYVFYQIPVNAKKMPLVFWHGIGQFSKTWETTPDGREGFQNIFLRRGFGVYVIDQPRRGNASRSMPCRWVAVSLSRSRNCGMVNVCS